MNLSKRMRVAVVAVCALTMHLGLSTGPSYGLDKMKNIGEDGVGSEITLRNIRKDTPVESIEVFTNDSTRVDITDMFRISSNFADKNGTITVLVDKGGCVNMPPVTDIVIRVIYPDNTSKDILYRL